MRIGTRVQRGHSEWVDDKGYVDVTEGPAGTVVAVETEPHYEGERPKNVTVRWDTGALEILDSDDTKENAACWFDLVDVTPRLFVNTYLHDKAFGGPEEGGWWYDCYSPEEEQCRQAADLESVRALIEHAQDFCDTENAHRNSNIDSVCSDGRYEVIVEAWPAEGSPSRRPHYC